MNKLTNDTMNHKAGEAITVLKFVGAGRFRVQFADGTTGIIGRSSFK